MSLPVLLALIGMQASTAPPAIPKAGPNQTSSTFDTPAPPVVSGVVAVPASNPGSWVSPADYPVEALREAKTGSVAFELIVRSSGTVEQCRVVGGSGSAALDEVTCRLLTERARFKPVMDAAGKPTSGYYRSSIRWQIPGMEVPSAGTVVYSYRVAPDGKIDDCRIESATGVIGPSATVGPTRCPPGAHRPSSDPDGKPVTRRVRITTRIDIEPEAETTAP